MKIISTVLAIVGLSLFVSACNGSNQSTQDLETFKKTCTDVDGADGKLVEINPTSFECHLANGLIIKSK